MSSLSDLYQKQRRRIQQAIRREIKKGLYVPDNILPPTPKKITKASVRRLEKITPETIRKKSYLVEADTGEAKKAKKNKIPHSATKKIDIGVNTLKREDTELPNREPKDVNLGNVITKQQLLDIDYNNWIYRIRSHAYGEGAAILERFFSNWENTIGKEETVKRVNQAISEGLELQDWVLYRADGALNFINDLLIFFPTAVNQFNELTELFDYFDEWEEYDN